eukprot:9493443-Pyramimonas_sp.AAC.1
MSCLEPHFLQSGQFLCPGLVDTHVHAAQYQFTGTGTDMPLMQWLQAYTFPAERRMKVTDPSTVHAHPLNIHVDRLYRPCKTHHRPC